MNLHNSKLKWRNSCLLIMAAFIWGFTFTAQSVGGDSVGPYSFNCIRSIIGGIVLLPTIGLLDHFNLTKHRPLGGEDWKTLLIGGIACGVALFIASNLQQMGIYLGTPSGKAGFLTACYMLLVPILGKFFHKKVSRNLWMAIAIALIGLYLLCIQGDFQIMFSDFFLLLCAVFYAVHILVIDYFTELVDGVRMSCIQFFICGIFSSVPMIWIEIKNSAEGILEWASTFSDPRAWIPILFAGILSCGLAFTLQIIGQKGVNPSVASLLMSTESVFSVLSGWMILGERLSIREILGCVLILGAVFLACFKKNII